MYLTEKKNVKVKFLSGGQKQRVALARALAFPSRILLLDESFNSQDYKLKMQLMDFIKQELSAAPKTLIFVTHDERDGKYLCDRIVYLDKAMSQE
jgi:ABC-type nitrate/sulfonate/bicarbonate transport system ATPase subunit